MDIPYSRHTLDNGLDVLVHEDHDCPIVAVNIWYHVGSKNEKPGRTGFAHLFEHLMFEGSQHYDRGYFQPLQEAGASLNGSTNADRTNYWEVVPPNALELALWMESDRMGFLLPALTDHKFENQRDVVLNERRQNYENRPYGFAGMAVVGALYAPDHPYHWLTIGGAQDIQAARLDDVRAFFQTYYRPRNASLALAGDVTTERALAMATEYFGPLDAGEPPLYIARRVVRAAAEDVGLADPRALSVALAAKDAMHFLGQPEGELALAEAVVYIATAPKSNRMYEAWGAALEAAREYPAEGVPLHIRNAPTGLMKELGYGKGYSYAHAAPEGYTAQEYLPEALRGNRFYEPTDFGFEKEVAKRMAWWQELKRRAGC